MIDKKPFSRNWKAMRDSLGIVLTQNWLIADCTLLVEGASDEFYIYASLQYLARANGVDVDLNELCIMQGQDSANLVAMASIMLEEGRRVVVLVDGDRSGTNTIADLRKTRTADVSNGTLVLVQLPAGSSIEDAVPFPEAVEECACTAGEELVAKGIREWDDDVTPADRRAQLRVARAARGQKTSGAVLNEQSGKWFKQRGKGAREGVGKVDIAIRFDEFLRTRPVGPPTEIPESTVSLFKDLAGHLRLGSRQADRAIVE